MDDVTLGHTGLKVSRLCLGCMTYGAKSWRDWVLSKPAITAPIIGASKPHHIPDAIAALDFKLSDEEIAALEHVWFTWNQTCSGSSMFRA